MEFHNSTSGFSSPDWSRDVFFTSTTTDPPPTDAVLFPGTEGVSGCQCTMSFDT